MDVRDDEAKVIAFLRSILTSVGLSQRPTYHTDQLFVFSGEGIIGEGRLVQAEYVVASNMLVLTAFTGDELTKVVEPPSDDALAKNEPPTLLQQTQRRVWNFRKRDWIDAVPCVVFFPTY